MTARSPTSERPDLSSETSAMDTASTAPGPTGEPADDSSTAEHPAAGRPARERLPETLRLADFPEKEHIAGPGNWLYKIPFRGDEAVLKIYFGNRNPMLHWRKTLGNVLITGRTSHMPRARCKTELDCITLWEKHGFTCFGIYPEVTFEDIPEGGYMLFDYMPGVHFCDYFGDDSIALEERMQTWRTWLPIWHRRHRTAIEVGDPRLIQENGDMKHVLLWKGEFVNFDFEVVFRSKDIRDLVGREMLAYLRSLGKSFGHEMYDLMMDEVIRSYPDKALLMEAYKHAIQNHNPFIRFFRTLDRKFKAENNKRYSKYSVALDLKRRLDAAALN
jgi:hypothetical protein